MKISVLASICVVGSTIASHGAVIFQDDFSTNTLAANFTTLGVTYNATPETVTISRGSGSNYLQIKDAFTLDTYGSTELTVSFNFSFGSSMFGSGFIVQYNDGVGGGWQNIASQSYTGTGANDSANATNFLTRTINEGATYTFSNSAQVRIIGTTNTGGKGYHIDNLVVAVDAIPEPSVSLLGGLGVLLLMRRRKA